MAIKGKTFDLQTITAKDDGALYRILSGESDMIVFSGSGTALSINSNILTIAECYLLVGGRYIHIEGGSTIDLGTIPNSSNRGRVIIQIDTSLGATQVTLDQVVPEIETIASVGSYRALVKNDINSDNGGSVYEIEFATFTCSSGVASSPALTTSVPTQTKIQALEDDIDTLADNLETTGEAVGTLQTSKANAGIGIFTGDLNDLSTAGWYQVNSGQTNTPADVTGIVKVIRSVGNTGGIITQEWTSVANGQMFHRQYTSTIGWTAWTKEACSVVPIEDGGTGATTSANAIANLGAVGQYFNSSATDINTILTAGIYRLQNNVTNYPSGATSNYSTLIVFRGTSSSDTATQIFSAYNDDNIWYRKIRGISSTVTFGSWVKWTGFKDITKVTYTNTALTGLQAKRLPFSSQDVIQGYGFVTATANADHITLPAGTYRIHTNFKTTPGANGLVKSCLKIGSTSTMFILTDQFYAGAGVGSNSSIIGVNATDVINLTASTNIYFLVMSHNDTEGCAGSLTIERLA